MCLERGVDRVAHDVDEELLELVAVRLNAERWPFTHLDAPPLLERGHAMDPLRHIDGTHARTRKPREARVRRHEAAERFRARADDGESPLEVLQPIIGTRRSSKQVLNASDDGPDGRERIIDLVTEHAYEPLPCLAFLVA